jgi:hypothetical protein
MAGGTAIPYGNIKNLFGLSVTPSGTNVGATSISIGTVGVLLTLTVPGLILGDLVMGASRSSQTINGNTAPATPFVSVDNVVVNAANSMQVVLSNSSTLAVSTPIEVYSIIVARVDTTNPPSTTPTGIYS